MKQLVTLIGLAPMMALGQSLVYPVPQNRTALLEEYTGIHCGYCPEGHAIAASLEGVLQDKFVTVGVHAGGYAVPGAGEPDFRTADGTAIDAYFTVGGYPAGTVNRHLFNGADDLGRGAWEGAVNDMLALPSPVNVGVESSFDGTTLTVHVVGLYTGNSPAGNDFLSVLIKENGLVGYQADYTNGTQPNYNAHARAPYVHHGHLGRGRGQPRRRRPGGAHVHVHLAGWSGTFRTARWWPSSARTTAKCTKRARYRPTAALRS